MPAAAVQPLPSESLPPLPHRSRPAIRALLVKSLPADLAEALAELAAIRGTTSTGAAVQVLQAAVPFYLARERDRTPLPDAPATT